MRLLAGSHLVKYISTGDDYYNNVVEDDIIL